MDFCIQLEAFLSQRLAELEADVEGDVLSSSQFQTAPSSVQIDSEAVRGMLGKVKVIMDQLTSVKMQHLMLIRNSPRLGTVELSTVKSSTFVRDLNSLLLWVNKNDKNKAMTKF